MAAAVTVVPALPLDAPAARRPPTPLRAGRPSYIGPLTGVTSGLDDRRFDPGGVHARPLQRAAPRRLRFQARTRAQAEEWQKTLRAEADRARRRLPGRARQPLRPVTLETRTFPGYRREKIVFDSRPGVSVLAYLLLPARRRSARRRP